MTAFVKWEQVTPSKPRENTTRDMSCCFRLRADVYTHETTLSCLLSRTNSIAVEHTVGSRLRSVFFEAGKSFAAPSCLGENVYLAAFMSQKNVEGVFEFHHG